MPKGYWVTVYRSISDPQKLAAYAQLAPPAIAPFGGRYLARGTAAAAFEAGQHVIHRLAGHMALPGQLDRPAPLGSRIQEHAELGRGNVEAIRV